MFLNIIEDIGFVFGLVLGGDGGGLTADVDPGRGVVLHAQGVGLVGDGVHLVDGERLGGHLNWIIKISYNDLNVRGRIREIRAQRRDGGVHGAALRAVQAEQSPADSSQGAHRGLREVPQVPAHQVSLVIATRIMMSR